MLDWIEVHVRTQIPAEEFHARLVEDVPALAGGVQLLSQDSFVVWEKPALAGDLGNLIEQVARKLGLDVSIELRDGAPEASWRNAWKKYFTVHHVTPSLVIVPSWENYTPKAQEKIIALDPGMAFGTGAHASTQLVLEKMEVLYGENRQVHACLDVGCGSGILTIGAERFWPNAELVAIDIDPDAVSASRENCQQNNVKAQISDAPVSRIPGEFDLVLANIQRPILLEMREALCGRVKSGGVLILAGLLTEHVEEVEQAYATSFPKSCIDRSTRNPEWSSVTLWKD